MVQTSLSAISGKAGKNSPLTADTLSRFLIRHNFRPVYRQHMKESQVFSHYCCKKNSVAIDLFTGYSNGFYAQVLIKGNPSCTHDIVFPVRRHISTLTNDYRQSENICLLKTQTKESFVKQPIYGQKDNQEIGTRHF